MLAQLALELEHPANGFGFLLGAGGVEPVAAAQHGFLDLAGDDGADFAEVFADGFHLEGGTHEEFQIAFQVADLAGDTGGVEAVADEVMDMHLVRLLAVAIHPAVALLHAVGVPGNLEVDQLGTVVLQVDAFGGGIGGEQDADRGFLGVGLEGGLDRLALIVGHAAVDHLQPAVLGEAFAGQQVEQPFLGGAVFGEDDDALVVPLAAGAQGLLEPVDQGLGLAVGALAGLGGVFAELLEQGLFFGGDWRQGLADGADDLAGFGFVFVVVGVIVGEILDVAVRLCWRTFVPPTVAMCFSRVMPKAAGEENRRFLSSLRTNSAAMRSPSEVACFRRSSEYCCRAWWAWRSSSV